MKRFWTLATAIRGDEGWRVELDGRPVRTPAHALFAVANEQLAKGVAAEWNGAAQTVDPRAMPLTGLVNAAIDRVGPAREAFAQGLARYGASDLLCYRAESPDALVARQAERWDALLDWARRRYDVDFVVTSGVAPVEQKPETLARLSHEVAILDAFTLAGLSPLVTVSGSLIVALAVHQQAADVDTAWAAASLDEAWQLEQWGSDPEAEMALSNREADFRAGARFVALVRD